MALCNAGDRSEELAMPTSARLIRWTVIVASTAVVNAFAAPVRAETIDELYTAAKKEGALSLMGGGPAGLYEPWVREFEQRFPGIKVTLRADFSNILDPIIDKQLAEHKLSVDLTIFQTLQDYDRWKKQGVLMIFKPDGWERIDSSFKDDPDGTSVGVAVYALSYAFNTKSASQAQLPKSAMDFLKPEFKGKVVTSYPNDDDITLYLFHTIVQKYGWEFMDKYMATDPLWIRGHLGVARVVASGQAEATFDAMANVTLGLKRTGQQTDVAFSTSDPLPIWPQTAAVFKDAPHPNAARLYISWFLQKDQQTRLGTWSVRNDVQPPAGLKPIFDYQLANDFRSFIVNERLVQEERKRFASYIGPPKGAPVIRTTDPLSPHRSGEQ
jgi:ABC-type Fe3+ transport system substrate-binding protein